MFNALCAVSYAVGRWRGEQRRTKLVPLAVGICEASFNFGHDEGVLARREREDARRASRPPRSRAA